MINTGCCCAVIRLKTTFWHFEFFLQPDFWWLHNWFRFYTWFWLIITMTSLCFRACVMSNWAVKFVSSKVLLCNLTCNDVYTCCMRVWSSQSRNSQPKLWCLVTFVTQLRYYRFKVCTLCNQGFCVEWAIYQPYLTSSYMCNNLKTSIFAVFHLFSPLLYLYT